MREVQAFSEIKVPPLFVGDAQICGMRIVFGWGWCWYRVSVKLRKNCVLHVPLVVSSVYQHVTSRPCARVDRKLTTRLAPLRCPLLPQRIFHQVAIVATEAVILIVFWPAFVCYAGIIACRLGNGACEAKDTFHVTLGALAIIW